MWLVFQMLVCPMTGAISRRLAEEQAAETADCYARYPDMTAADAPITGHCQVAAMVKASDDSAVHRIRLISACVKWDLAYAAEAGERPRGFRSRPFCGPYMEAQWDAQQSLISLLKSLSSSDGQTSTQAAALASIVELTRTHPHAVHELVVAGGLGHVARILVHASDDRCGRHARLAACSLLHVVAAQWETSRGSFGQARSLLALASAAA